MDGFHSAQQYGSNIQVRQQRRANGLRIETLVGPSLMVSADVSNSGKTEILEGYASKFVPTTKELAAFDSCLARYAA